MKGPKPTPEEHLAATGRKLEVQTDKEAFKVVPCTYAGCGTDLVVNTFYAPYKGKCSMHGDRTNKAVVASHLTFQTSDEEIKPNGALAKLLCPICSNPLTILKIEEMGWITFGCTDGAGLDWKTVRDKVNAGTTFCGTSITVRPHWAAMEMKQVPSALVDLVHEFNIDQKVKYFDKAGY
jgi:hypothetical protein